MSVLSDLVDDAANDTVPTNVLLRRMKVLAVRLKTPPLAAWVQRELDGYGPDDPLPEYRGPFVCEALGTFTGPFGSGMENGRMPMMGIHEDWRDAFRDLCAAEFRQGVGALEDLRRGSEGHLSLSWPANAVALTSTLIDEGKIAWYDGMYLASARTVVPDGLLVGAIESVRTRVLDLALGIESEDPSAGDPASASIAPEQVATIYNTVVNGGNVALGSSDFSQALSSAPIDLNDLLSRLQEIGVPEAMRADLVVAIEQDGPITDGPGERVQGWLSRSAVWAGNQASNTGSGALGGVVAQLVLLHLGLVPSP